MTQSFFVAESQTGRRGVYVPLQTTLHDANEIINGGTDSISEEKFLFVGSITDIK